MRLWTALLLILFTASAAAAPCFQGTASIDAPRVPSGFRFAAVGDMILQGPASRFIKERAPQITRELGAADVAFGNFETNSFDLDSVAVQKRTPPEGPVLLAPPEVPRELKALGLTLVSTANNHAGDWGPQGVIATLRTLQDAGLAAAGTGRDLPAARAPGCVRVKGATVALVAVTSSFEADDPATPERAGVSALHVMKTDGTYQAEESDRQQVLEAIRQVRSRVALVWASLHTHQAEGDPERPTAFEVRLAHDAIDAGADLFVAHGPHLLRGIEIYKGHVIFYSLGNFAVMQPLARINPTPMVIPPGSVFSRRASVESVVATGRYDHGRLSEVRLHPFELNPSDEAKAHGLPQAVMPEAGRAILERMQRLSQALGTAMSIEDGVGVIHVPAS